MPTRSQSALSEHRKTKDRTSDRHHSSKDGTKSGVRRRTASGSKVSSRSLAPGKTSTSSVNSGNRIAATPSISGKSARRDPATTTGHSASSKPPPSSKAGHAAGNGSGGGGGGGGNVSGSAGKPSFHVPAVLTKKEGSTSGASVKPSAYKEFGPSSKLEESETNHLPDPYLELQKAANEEIKLKEHADLLHRTKSGLPMVPGLAGVGNSSGGTKPHTGSAAGTSPAWGSVLGGASSGGRASSAASGGAGCPGSDAGCDGAAASPRANSGATAHGSWGGAGGGSSSNSSSRPPSCASNNGIRKGGVSSSSKPDNTGSRAGSGCSGGTGSVGAAAVVCGSGSSSGGGGGQVSPSTKCPTSARSTSCSNKSRITSGTRGSAVDPKVVRPRDRTPPDLPDEEDDEEDETGMPQAVRQTEAPTGEPETNQEITKRLHRARMEGIARSVEPAQLLRHLTQAGYFRCDYNGHTRTTMDNHNLKYGMKKGIERLYLWLSLYNPSDDSCTPRS